MPRPFDLIPPLLQGLGVTVEITVLSILLTIAIAFVAGLARLSPFWPVRWLTTAYVEFFRGSSLMVQLFWLYFVLPYFGIRMGAFTVAVLGLGLNGGAYGAEIVRSAVLAVPKGQREAAVALNMSPWKSLSRIILPQATRIMLPPFGNLAIDLLKSTSLVSLIAITDLTFRGYQLNTLTLRTTEIFSLLLVIYLILALLITGIVRLLERSLTVGVEPVRSH